MKSSGIAIVGMAGRFPGARDEVAIQVQGAAHEVIEVTPGDAYKRSGRRQYTIRPGVREDYDALLADLAGRNASPRKIVHLWSVRDGAARPSLDDQLDLSFYSLLFLAQAIGEQDLSDVDIAVVSDRLQSVADEPVADPVAATLLGPTRVIPKELPGIACRSIDVDLTSQGLAQVAVQILAEHCAPFGDPVVAIRPGERWVEDVERVVLHADSRPAAARLKPRGVYLITGGLGDIGLAIAERLARDFEARLVLLGRTPLPPVGEWRDALEEAGIPERVKQRIRKLIEIESLGGEILALSCDVCSRDDLRRSIEAARTRFGPIDGVIHAAGAIEDGPLQLKSRESASRVLAPKVGGTLALVDVLREMTASDGGGATGFLAMFSSVSSATAPAGQVDYAAANAFLDAFAAGRREAGVVAINWGPWRDVGMAARASSSHPLLGRRVVDTPDEIVVSSSLDAKWNWMLAEHRLKGGKAVVPGTGYLEMACAALTRGAFDRGVAFEDVFFVAPLLADPGQTREARVVLRRGGDGAFSFSILAREAEWVEHASGRIARCTQPPPQDRDVEAIAARCRSGELAFNDAHRTEQERYFEFGPRWRCSRDPHR